MMPLVFGEDRDPGVLGDMGDRTKSGSMKTNPMVRAYGPGPAGKQCGGCSHLFARGGTSGRYYKCALRNNSSSAATDHRVRWQACSRFDEAKS